MKLDLFSNLNFLLLGNSILIGWNSVITSLDFFSSKFGQPKISFYMVIPCNISTLIFNILMGYIGKKTTLDRRIVVNLVFLIICLLLFPILAYIFSNLFGFWIFLILNFVISGHMSILQSSVLGMASFYHDSCMSSLNAGFAASGILICLIRIILLSTFDSNDQYNIICMISYYGISAIFVIISLIFYFKFTKSNSYYNLDNDNLLIYDEESSDTTLQNEKSVSYKENYKFIINNFWKMFPYPPLIACLYIQTFIIFPALALNYSLYNMNSIWSEVVLLLIYNIFDMIGRYASLLKFFYEKKSCSIFIISRFIFIATFYIFYKNLQIYILNSSYFCVINMILFAFTNGYATTTLFILSSDLFKDKHEKELAEFFMSFMMSVGMMIGSLCSLGFSN